MVKRERPSSPPASITSINAKNPIPWNRTTAPVTSSEILTSNFEKVELSDEPPKKKSRDGKGQAKVSSGEKEKGSGKTVSRLLSRLLHDLGNYGHASCFLAGGRRDKG